jgi:hypothetical protein
MQQGKREGQRKSRNRRMERLWITLQRLARFGYPPTSRGKVRFVLAKPLQVRHNARWRQSRRPLDVTEERQCSESPGLPTIA